MCLQLFFPADFPQSWEASPETGSHPTAWLHHPLSPNHPLYRGPRELRQFRDLGRGLGGIGRLWVETRGLGLHFARPSPPAETRFLPGDRRRVRRLHALDERRRLGQKGKVAARDGDHHGRMPSFSHCRDHSSSGSAMRFVLSPRGTRASITARTRSGARKASAIVLAIWRLV
jgi:hypothetical protein